MKVATELVIDSNNLNYLSENAYDSSKWNLAKGLIYNNGATAVDKYIAPLFSVMRPAEESAAFTVSYISGHSFSKIINYVFMVENSVAAAATRRIHLYSNNKKTGATSWIGFITITLASATAHTVRSFKMDVKNESTGTIQTIGTALTGSGTLFATNKVAVGARIGFGSTDPTQITTWYRISARTSDTALTLLTSPGNLPASTPYVIQEFRPVYIATNATLTNGGIHYGKGISIEDFTPAGTTIALATTVDDVKAMYWEKDAAVQTNNVAAGCVIDFETATPTNLDCYVMDLVSAGNYKFYKYNLRAALTVSAGASTNAFVLATGNNPFSVTGVQNDSICIATANHGSGNGVKSLYLLSTTRIYRVPVTQITSGSITVFSSPSDVIIETPPGGSTTYSAMSAFSSIEYITDLDMFLITNSVTGAMYYITKYNASGVPFDAAFVRQTRILDASTKNLNLPSQLDTSSILIPFDVAGTNLVYFIKTGGQVYCAAIGGDSSFNQNCYLISPAIPTSNALKYYRVFANHLHRVGGGIFAKPTEPFDIYVRTANINTDATSGWFLVNEDNDISSFAGAGSIQFKFTFKTIGDTCIPARILGLSVIYEDNTGDSHYSFSTDKSSATTKKFAWWFKTAFGSSVPILTIRLYNAVTGGLLLTDTTSPGLLGTWEKSIDGGVTWGVYNNTDRANDLTYIRYTPTSLADNVNIEASITQG